MFSEGPDWGGDIMEFIMKPHLLAAAVAVLLSGSPALAQDAAAPAYLSLIHI